MNDERILALDGDSLLVVEAVDSLAAATALARGHLSGPTASAYLAQALAGVDVGDPVLAANALRQAAEAIGRIVGKTYSDDLLEELFSRFCVGK